MNIQLSKPLNWVAVLFFCALGSPAQADFAAVYTQNAINMSIPIMNSAINTSIANNARRSYEEKWGENGTESGKQNQSVKKPWTAEKTNFSPDPKLTEKLQKDFIGPMDNEKARNVMALLLTEKTALRVYKDFHPEVKLSFQDIADTFTVASLSAFMTIEDRKNVTTEQVNGVREKFRSRFANHSMKKSEVQTTTQQMMYWLLLKVYSESKAEGDPKALAKVKADASSIMESIGFSPKKYTLGSNGFVAK
jgi:hypothetical protein